ncbi:hypothetical protein F5X68DRAFT_79607 [Plectosphaerella plurivora]|uniref:Uncharacterized protein n=1 Tax=Plectosphaerella plurivora TaxID=936078 RepID=A0A9P9ACL5_9PEZI|nr:hypothetical protein F5X68DRAFT_79607 [Plectosphaerella plurivora]
MPRSKRRLEATETPWWLPFSGSVFRQLRQALNIDGSVIDYIDGLAIHACPLTDMRPGDILKYDIRTPSIGSMPWSHTAMSPSYNPETRETNVIVFGRWRDSSREDITRNIYDRVCDSPKTAFHPFHALFPFIYGEYARYNSAVANWDRAAEALTVTARQLRDTPACARDSLAYREAYHQHRIASRQCHSRAAALEKTMCSWWGLLAFLDRATRYLKSIQHNWPPSKSPVEEREHAEWRKRQMDAAADDIIANIDMLVECLGKDVAALRERIERGILEADDTD